MFGYVQLYKPELKMREYEQYRGVYCSLCKRLGRRYGALLRLGLTYDMTFFALLNVSLQRECVGFRPSRCTYRPTKKCLACETTDELDFAADVTALLLYYRALDTLADEGFFAGFRMRIALPFLRRYYRKAQALRPETDRQIAAMMEAQRDLETAKTASVDAAAEPFALFLQALCAGLAKEERMQRVLSRFGYCLGRYIYLADAAADMREDGRRGRYNPFILSRRLDMNDQAAVADCERYAADVLRHCQAECIAAYELMDVRHFDGILRNILEDGITNQITRLFAEKQKGVKKHKL